MTISTKICDCGAEHFLNFAEKSSQRTFYENSTNNQFISFTKETIFEMSLLNNFTAHLIFCHTTFMGFCDAYDYMFKSKESYIIEKSRKVLNPKRLAEAWIYLRILLFEIEINGCLSRFNGFPVNGINRYLMNIRKSLHPYFISKWSGNLHTAECSNKNCSVAFVIDGLHKTNRLKCMKVKEYTIPEISI